MPKRCITPLNGIDACLATRGRCQPRILNQRRESEHCSIRRDVADGRQLQLQSTFSIQKCNSAAIVIVMEDEEFG